jgi:sialate O-acetylesterase
VRFGKVSAVGLGEGLFDAEIDSGDEFEVVLRGGKNPDRGKDGVCDRGAVRAIDPQFPETGADFARGLEILPEVEADFVLRFPESDGRKPAPEESGSMRFPSLQVFEPGNAFFGIAGVHDRAQRWMLAKWTGNERRLVWRGDQIRGIVVYWLSTDFQRALPSGMNHSVMLRLPFKTLFFTWFVLLVNAYGDVVPSSLFTDHMVLQRGMAVPIWGNADAGESVRVEFAGQSKTTRVDAEGKWMLRLASLEASEVGREMRISGKNEVVFEDVLVGEVWICSGQSNMQFGSGGVPGVKALIPEAGEVRTFEVKRTVAFEPKDSVEGTWKDEVPGSAVAAGFSILLEQAADVPVGIILSCWGSSSLEAWMPRDLEEKFPLLKEQMSLLDEGTEARTRIQSALDGPKAWSRPDDIFMRRQSTILYNAMIHPLAPYACRGLVWYQGERNAANLDTLPKEPWYRRSIPALMYGEALKLWMQRYRQQWGREDFYFMVVMLPGYARGLEKQAESPTAASWAWMRESQLEALELPGTSVVNTIDLGHLTNIHPADKLPIGHRLALLAQRDTLSKDIVAEGPVMSQVEAQGNTLVVRYDYAKGLMTKDGAAPKAFWIAGAAGKWMPAEAELRGETVVLQADGLAKPLYVRYAFAGMPRTNLVNAVKLPARPFRTDSFAPSE